MHDPVVTYEDSGHFSVPCREPIYGPMGDVYATRNREGGHNWVLHSRVPLTIANYQPQKDAPGYGVTTIKRTGWTEVWYCSHCRLVETRESIEGGDDAR